MYEKNNFFGGGIMSKINSVRSGCKDVFNAFLVATATYAGIFEFPVIRISCCIPKRIIAFSKAISCKDYDQWVHFYEDDCSFERLWNNPCKYLSILKRYQGVILPDFSLYRDMPFVMQLWNIYRSRALGHWFQENGIKVIPNIRFGDRRTFRICCDGIEKHSVIAVGSHGTMKHKNDREVFLAGFDVIVKTIHPSVVIIYGCASDKYFHKYIQSGIRIVRFESEYSASHKGVV